MNGITFDRLVDRVNDIRRRNGYSEYSREEFEDIFCRERLGCDEEYVIKVGGEGSGRASMSGEVVVLRATQRGIDEWRSNGWDLVSVEELRSRVDKCLVCDYNKELICTKCLGYDTWVYGYIQGIGVERMRLLVGLNICLIDKVMIVIDILNKGISRQGGYCDGCWKVNK